MKTKVLVTGANGQLGQCLQLLVPQSGLEFTFLGSDTLDISSKKNINSVINTTYTFCINCAAYTAVDKAESDIEKANLINNKAVEYLAKSCKQNNITLIHISTDFVFNGEKQKPYNENDKTNPISIYGQTKLDGEKAIESNLAHYYIIRTSWLYSQFANNFVKSMLNFAKTKKEISIINDQMGTPTFALDLAEVLLKIISSNTKKYGTYHYSNNGMASWFDFAQQIFTQTKASIKVNAIPTSSYPTPANRPKYSVLDKSKIIANFNINVPNWKDSLDKCLKALI